MGPDHPHTVATEQFLAEAYSAAGKSSKAEPLLRNFLDRRRKQFGSADPRTAGAMAVLGAHLVEQRKWPEADTLLRECLAIREIAQPDDWSTFNTRSMLGASSLGQKKFAEAEPLLLAGYQGMKAREARIPAAGKVRLAEAGERIVRLYEAWGKKDKADESARQGARTFKAEQVGHVGHQRSHASRPEPFPSARSLAILGSPRAAIRCWPESPVPN